MMSTLAMPLTSVHAFADSFAPHIMTARPPTPADPAHLSELIEHYCSPEWKELLRERNTVLTFRTGEHIFRSGDHADRMFMIARGCVKVTAKLTSDTERIIRLAGDGEVLGHRAIGDEPVYAATATALTATEVNSIPMPLFLNTLKANGAFCYQFLLFFAEDMRRLEQQMRDLSRLDVTGRVARVIKLNMDTFGFDVKQPGKLAFTLSRRDIANAAGTTYESVIRTLAQLHRRRIITLAGKEIHIRNAMALVKLISH